MAELKTKPTTQPAEEFLNTVEPEWKRKDSFELLKIFKEITGKEPVMWGTSIVGFGMYHYKSERSTQEGDWPLTGFSPRKQNLTLYVLSNGLDKSDFVGLGKFKTSVSCLYINKLADVNVEVLKKLITKSYEHHKKTLLPKN
ncbi:MAG: DUF1801 domain-containing protein [Candidatus Doudnabacteria bacterium]|nr:DUF1801 domain-containing protein [Candidatus Doudnabacteria bacterium]